MTLKAPVSIRFAGWFWILNGIVGLIWMLIALIMMGVETITSRDEFGWGAVIFAAMVTLILVGGLCGFFIWVGVGALKMRYPRGILRGNAIGALVLGSLGLLSWFDMIGADRPGMTPAPDQAMISEEPQTEQTDTAEASAVGDPEAKSIMDLLVSIGWAGSGLLALSGATTYEAARRAKKTLAEQA